MINNHDPPRAFMQQAANDGGAYTAAVPVTA
jgi:hypothetical protein